MKGWSGALASFRGRVLLCFLQVKLILLAWILAYFSINNQREELNQLSSDLKMVQHEFIANNRNLQAFLIRGYRSELFQTSGKEPSIKLFLSQNRDLRRELIVLNSEFGEFEIDQHSCISRMITASMALEDSVVKLVQILKQRGFVNHGVEGRMRKLAHQLEEAPSLKPVDLLELRRLEKDFLMRSDQRYVDEFRRLSDHLHQSGLSVRSRQLLEAYTREFNHLVSLEQRLGITTDKGLYRNVQAANRKIESMFSKLHGRGFQQIEAINRRMKNILYLISTLALLLVVGLSLYFSGRLTRDIRILSQRVMAFKNSGFLKESEYRAFTPDTREVYYLNREFEQLIHRLKLSMERLEEDKARAEQISKYKSLFLANMSHEIRTPLNGIVGMMHALENSRITTEQREYIDVMEYSANHLLDLVNMILDYSKIDAGRMELEHTEFDLNGDLAKLMRIFELKSREKGVALKLITKGDTSRMIKGDPLRLQQVLINLVNNALKFTKQGEVELRVEELDCNDEFQRLKFSVRDTGIGISSAQISRLFKAFEQSDSSITRQYGGTGLGLTISNSLVQLMDSKLEVESTPGQGSTFSFVVDFEIGGSKEGIVKEAEQSSVPAGVGLRVLVAEDNLINQKVLKLMLEQEGATTDLAGNGKEALALFEANQYDLILMDIQMPEMDGLQATRLIRASTKYYPQKPPIIAVTANAFKEDRQLAQAAGMSDFLSKPVQPSELKATLARYSALSLSD